MSKFNWMDITREDVIHAIGRFLSENPEYPVPRSTFLLFEGKKLPAKHIRGMAYYEHYRKEISKNDYTGGMETVRFFKRLGFETYYTDGAKSEKTASDPIRKNDPGKTRKAPAHKKPKISVPSKGVTEQKNALQLILNRLFDGDVVCEKTYPWLRTPEVIEGPYMNVCQDLSSYRGDTTFAKKNVTLRCDFVCESRKLIIEYDERQHFSEARSVALEAYKEIPVYFDRSLWIDACHDISARDNAPFNRDEVRAYYDSVRDIACWQNGYKLVRIMHGQVDLNQEGATQELLRILGPAIGEVTEAAGKNPQVDDTFQVAGRREDTKPGVVTSSEPAESIKVAMYLQTNELKNQKSFDKMLPLLKAADVDIIVFPEFCYVPFVGQMTKMDIAKETEADKIRGMCRKFSSELGKAVIVSSHDKFGTIFSIYANAFAEGEETSISTYIKHTACGRSCLGFENYPSMAPIIFDPINYKGFLIGMTICYDCNHALFSRMYGIYGIDLIINSTGGNVVYDKWFKYNKARAIENNCFELVTMGGDGTKENGHNYVYGFNPNGGQLQPENLNGSSKEHNVPGGLYVYEITKDTGAAEPDNSNQFETVNKNVRFAWPVGGSADILKSAEKLTDHIYRQRVGKDNVFLLLVDGMDIMKPEKVQPLLYAKEIKTYTNRKYIIINRHDHIDPVFFREKLSVILKVRAMENFCAVILESDDLNKCYQCGKNRTSQVVRAVNGTFGIDLSRTSGPDTIWKNKTDMRASWRKNYEWLIKNAEKLWEHSEP